MKLQLTILACLIGLSVFSQPLVRNQLDTNSPPRVTQDLFQTSLYTNAGASVYYWWTNRLSGAWLGIVPGLGLVKSNAIAGVGSLLAGTNGAPNIGGMTSVGPGNGVFTNAIAVGYGTIAASSAPLTVVNSANGGVLGSVAQSELVNTHTSIGDWIGTSYSWIPNNAHTHQAWVGTRLVDLNNFYGSDWMVCVKTNNGDNTLAPFLTVKFGGAVKIGNTNTLTDNMAFSVKDNRGNISTLWVEAATNANHFVINHDGVNATMACDGIMKWLGGAGSQTAFSWYTYSGVGYTNHMYMDASGQLVFTNGASGNQPFIVLGTNGQILISAPTNAVAPPPQVPQPIGYFASMMLTNTNTVTIGAGSTYYVLTNFTTLRTNGFVTIGTNGFITNVTAGFYRITCNVSMVSGGSDTLEGALFLDETRKPEITVFGTYDNPARIRTMSASGILYMPAATGLSFRLNNNSGANNITVWRAGVTVGTP